LSQCGHFVDKGEGVIFAILCGRLLWTAPNLVALHRNIKNQAR